MKRRPWESSVCLANQLLAFQGLGEKESSEQEIKCRKVSGVTGGHMGSDVEGLKWHTRKRTACAVDNGDKARLGVLSMETAR